MVGEMDAACDIWDTLKETRAINCVPKDGEVIVNGEAVKVSDLSENQLALLAQSRNSRLTVAKFQQMCLERNESGIFAQRTKHWILPDWSGAIAGEAGELCNLVKKVRRGDFPTNEQMREVQDKMAKEAADVITYAFLFLAKMGRDAEVELLGKFEEVTQRHAPLLCCQKCLQDVCVCNDPDHAVASMENEGGVNHVREYLR